VSPSNITAAHYSSCLSKNLSHPIAKTNTIMSEGITLKPIKGNICTYPRSPIPTFLAEAMPEFLKRYGVHHMMPLYNITITFVKSKTTPSKPPTITSKPPAHGVSSLHSSHSSQSLAYLITYLIAKTMSLLPSQWF
jgi:hypothetical protein